MVRSRLWWLFVIVASCIGGSLPAQQPRPTPDEARVLLQTRPDLVAQLRQRLASSGLTPDQVRARLRAEGYPEDLLDAYMPGSTADAASDVSGDSLFEAAAALGITDSTDSAVLRQIQLRRRRTRPRAARGVVGDSLDILGDSSDSIAVTPADSSERIFGLDFFDRETSLFEPNLAGPVDASYRLGPGDRLVLILTGDVENAYTLDVTREGFVVIPQVGQVFVNNLTLSQLDDVLYTRLGRVYSGVRRGSGATTRFSVSVAKLRSNQVYVVGDVRNPGSYRISSAGTALTALYAAGGPLPSGSMRQIEVRRSGQTVQTLDVYDYLVRGDASRDARLQNGDVVFVPVHGPEVRVTGEVVRPATYELKPGETLRELLKAAGGLSATAARNRIHIERIVPPQARAAAGRDRVVIDVTADQGGSVASVAVPLEAGDVVHVLRIADRVRNRVWVEGRVWSPGPVAFTAGMRLSDALRLAGGPQPDVYLGDVLIDRLRGDSSRVELHAALRDSTGSVLTDFALAEDDSIRVFSTSEFRPRRYVAITGAVRSGGRFEYREGMTIRDLVLLAGGLKDGAYLREAEIARLPEDRSRGQTAVTIRVPLDSTYLADLNVPRRITPAGALEVPDFALKPFDNVLIRREPGWELQRTVTISGEVGFPGRYALVKKDERLSDVLKRAGGLTAEAYADGVFFFRPKNRTGRIGIDLPSVLRHPDVPDNLILQDGDSIYVPTYTAVVNVAGAVNSPVALAYVPGKDLDYYIRAAGGPSQKADPARAYVTQPNGKVESIKRRHFLPDGVPKPRAGSVVFVPDRDNSDRRDYTGLATAGVQILGSIVALVAILKR